MRDRAGLFAAPRDLTPQHIRFGINSNHGDGASKIMDPELLFDQYQHPEALGREGARDRRGLRDNLGTAAMGAVGVAALAGAAKLASPALISRRGFLTGAGAAGATLAATGASAKQSVLLCPPQVGRFGGGGLSGGPASLVEGDFDYSGAVPDDGPGLRHLKMVNPHNHERFEGDFVVDGQYNQPVLDQFAQFARDWRQNEAKPFSPATIEIIWKIWRTLEMDEPFRLNSGYRSPRTNASLPGAATQSLHLKAMAADLSCDSRSPAQVHAVARQIGGGGVGRYNTFTHVDSGRVRYWGG